MSTFMTILSLVMIGQFSTDQAQASASGEPAQRTAPAKDTRPVADIFAPGAKETNSTTEPATQKKIPDASPTEPATNTEIPDALPTQPATQKKIPDAATSSRSASTAVDRASTLTEQPVPLRIRPPQLIAEAMALPPGSVISGRPLSLVQALSASQDRRQQLAITRAYWQTAEALAKYHYCLDHANQLGRLQVRPGDEPSLQASRAAATALLGEAELAVGSAQYELAALAQFPADAQLPLPADRPHVGAYRTNYQELFAARPAPDRARLIDRTLPVRRMGIDQRAIAVQAAQDALTAAIDAYQAGQGNLASVVSGSGQLLTQQRAFIETVCRYNQDIAEYALIVAAPGAMPQVLVGFMIKTPQESGQSSSAEWEGGVRPAGLTEPASYPTPTWNGNNQPTSTPRNVQGASVIPSVPPATQWGPSALPMKSEPTLAPQRDATSSTGKKEPTPAPPRGLVPVGAKNEPTLAPPRGEKSPKTKDQSQPAPAEGEEPAKIRYSVGDPFSRRVETANKPAIESGLADAGTSTALYPALVEATPSVRAKQLTLALNWDRSLPEGAGRGVTIEECLSRQTGGDRRATIEAFWNARQKAAEYQVIAQEIEFLDDLVPPALERRARPGGAAAMLFLHAARQSGRANLQEAQAALIEAQFELALRTQSAAESLWPLPSTPPHAGQYSLNLEAQPPAMVQSWPMRRLAAAIPACSTNLQECAASVVTADTVRAKSIEQYTAGNLPIEQVLEQVARQTQQTFDFLQTLTDYNRSIAQYALAILPPDAPPTRIAAALVVQR